MPVVTVAGDNAREGLRETELVGGGGMLGCGRSSPVCGEFTPRVAWPSSLLRLSSARAKVKI